MIREKKGGFMSKKRLIACFVIVFLAVNYMHLIYLRSFPLELILPFLGAEIAVILGTGGVFFEKIMKSLGLKAKRKHYIFLLISGIFLTIMTMIRYQLNI
jgi:hypothetical protein